jgi:hypothetical protein
MVLFLTYCTSMMSFHIDKTHFILFFEKNKNLNFEKHLLAILLWSKVVYYDIVKWVMKLFRSSCSLQEELWWFFPQKQFLSHFEREFNDETDPWGEVLHNGAVHVNQVTV